VSVAGSKVRVSAALVLAMAAVALASHGRDDAPPAEPTGRRAPSEARAPERPTARALREGRPLELNRASEADLVLLPGIGPSLARRIVASREEEGLFPTVDALDRVRGIGPATLERLRPLLRVSSVRVPEDARPEPGGDRHHVDRVDVPDG
jgi:competence protein ComEA